MIRSIVEERGIAHLCHFTRVENLASILANGLVPRSRLEEENVQYVYNDDYRFDGCLNASCLTISFPNYRMFYPLRCSDDSKDWVVIRLNSRALWEKECAFCNNNAACGTVTSVPLEQRKNPQAFQSLFEDTTGMPSRVTTGVRQNFTTNPQAEVLIFDVVEPDFIVDVNFRNKQNINDANAINGIIGNFPHFQYWLNESLFSYRSDYTHWQNH